MIYGIGVDSTTIERIASSMQKPTFMQRVYSPAEQALFASLSPTHAAESAAANFAAKEAFLKATGNGLGAFSLADISALRHPSGAPYFALTGTALAFCQQHSLTAHLSLTHEKQHATAFVVLEKV